jgi:hypothetical protein
VNAVIADRKWETCGAINESVDSFAYDAEYSYDDYYQSDSVKVYSHGPKLDHLIAIRKSTLRIKRKNDMSEYHT